MFIKHPEEPFYQDEEDRADWNYDLDSPAGPQSWHSLDRAFLSCAFPNQSPIDMEEFTIAPSGVPFVSLNYKIGYLLLRNTGNYIRIVNHRVNNMMLGGKVFHLMYMGLHSPSEHQINGESFPAEIQFVHKAEDGTFAVISLLLDVGDGEISHPLIEEVLSDAPTNIGESFTQHPFDLVRALPLDITSTFADTRVSYPYYTYDGSLTTPPCNTRVQWLVWSKPDHISNAQVEGLEKLLKIPSARPLQPRGSRRVQYKNLFV